MLLTKPLRTKLNLQLTNEPQLKGKNMDASASLLLFGLHENDVQAVRRAVAQGASLATPADPTDPELLPPLMLAAKWGSVEMCQVLIELGANPHYTTHGKLKITAISSAAYYGQKDVCRYLLETGSTEEEIKFALDLAKSGATNFGQGSRAERYKDTINLLRCALGVSALPS